MSELDTNKELFSLIEEIKKRPGMFLGSKSLTKFSTYIDGFLYGIYIASERKNSKNFFSDFQDWIANRFDIKTTHHWSSIIRFFSVDDSSAFDMFYELFEAFLKEKQIKTK